VIDLAKGVRCGLQSVAEILNLRAISTKPNRSLEEMRAHAAFHMQQ
jgi:hypothetical protein